ncbi:AsmA family protein [Mangrovimicrobium sediminis]|uniref:AsmA family protein n=1 Tax=Mangrovimicrobium sediminis TaxID=2562682 RepID=A0A4Z0M240_9GAMM|nr:AsmA family protein [Haliea sp. SAOS-164]TGD73621.1 AsmA family protein [Haliea sp. SAOS-164]
MRKLVIVLLLLLCLLLAPLLAMRSERTLLWLADWAVDTFTDLRLVLVDPVLRPLEGEVSAREIHLYPKAEDGPPFLSVLGFSGDIDATDLYLGDLDNTALRAEQVIVYVSDRDSTSNPQPREWLGYAGWLPRTLEVGQLHVVTTAEETLVFPLQGIAGSRSDHDHYRLGASAQYDGEPLALAANIAAVRSGRQFTGLDIDVTASAPASDSRVHLAGELRGGEDDFTYDMELQGDYTEVSDFLRGFGVHQALRGHLVVAARMRGDTQGFQLSDANFTLDNRPRYRVHASGELEFHRGSGSKLSLDAEGSVESMAMLVDWIDMDLSPLGSADASARISGSLRQPVIDHFLLRTRSDSGLSVNVSGRLRADETSAAHNQVAVNIAGPNLAVLAPWTGELPFEAGPFRARGKLARPVAGGDISLGNLVVELGRPDDVSMRLSGNVAAITGFAEETPTRLQGIDLLVQLQTPDTAHLARFGAEDVPAGFALSGRVRLSGDDRALQVGQGQFSASAPGLVLRATPQAGTVYPRQDQPLQGLRAQLQLLAEDVAGLSPLVGQQFPALGKLTGSAQLVQEKQRFRLDDLALALAGAGLNARAEGRVPDLATPATLSMDLDIKLHDPQRVEAATGMRLQAGDGQLHLSSAADALALAGDVRVGQTHINAQGKLTFEQDKLQSLTLALRSPRVRLKDLGLQAEVQATDGYRPAEQFEGPSFAERLEHHLQNPPRYATDISVDIDGIVGENTNIQSLHLQLTGEQARYTLRRLSIAYDESPAEVRGIIDLNSSPPFASLAVEALSIPLSTLTRDLGIDFQVTGRANLRGGLSAQGMNVESLLRNMDGSLALALEDAEIEGAAYDVLATDLLAWFYSGAALENATHIDCTLAQFKLAKGVATADDLYIETTKMVATGTAKLDFPQEKMDVKFTPLSKSRSLQIPSAVRLRGDFAKPQVTVSPIAAAFDATAEFLTLVPRMARKLFGAESNTSATRPCVTGQ